MLKHYESTPTDGNLSFFTSRILDIHTSSDSSTSRGWVSFAISTDSIAGALGFGHRHLGKARIARVGVIKLKVPPWRIGNLPTKRKQNAQIYTQNVCLSSSRLPTYLPIYEQRNRGVQRLPKDSCTRDAWNWTFYPKAARRPLLFSHLS